MAHGYAVAYARDTEGERDPAGLYDALPDLVNELIEMDVTGDDVVLGVRNADERLRKVCVRQTNCPEEAPTRGLLDTFGDYIAAHAIAGREYQKE